MASEYYTHGSYPATGAAGSSSGMRSELDAVDAGFTKLPTITGNGGKILAVNAGATALEAITTTGTGSGVRATSPTLVTPALGTPSALVGTNITGTASGLTAGNVTTNANLTGPITSTGNATAVAAQTGTGSTFVMQASPTLTTPNIGTPSAGVATNLTGLPLTTGVAGTLPIANGGTNATSAAAARTSLGAAASGANSDITSISGLTTALSIAQGGRGATTLPACMMYLTSNVAASATPTKLTGFTQDFSFDSLIDIPSHRLLVAVTGVYQVNYAVQFDLTSDSGLAFIYKNGVQWQAGTSSAATGFQHRSVNGLMMSLTASDYLELYAQRGGTACNAVAGRGTFISAALVRAA